MTDTDTSAPERIWLQDDGDYKGAQAALSDLTWCADQINEGDTEYIRADLYTTVCAERDALKAELSDMTRCVTPDCPLYSARGLSISRSMESVAPPP